MQKRSSSDGLKIQLDSYSAAARSSATLATLRRRMGNWPAYAAVTGSALAAATSASAFQIVIILGAAGNGVGALAQQWHISPRCSDRECAGILCCREPAYDELWFNRQDRGAAGP